MKHVHLLGTLGEKFGAEWKADCSSMKEVFQLIACQTSGFDKYLVDCHEKGIQFSIKAGSDFIGKDELGLNISNRDIFITDIPAGAAGSSGWGKLFAAAAIVAVIYFTGGFAGAGVFGAGAGTSAAGLSTVGQIAFALAINLAITGINELLLPDPSKGSKEEYYFSGPVNTVKQGQPVPVLYGELIVGGAPISVTYTKRKVNSAGFIYNSANNAVGDFDAVSSLDPDNLVA